jgi:hypothetical protein
LFVVAKLAQQAGPRFAETVGTNLTGGFMFKSLITVTAVAVLAAAPLVASAQDSSQVSRPEVKSDLTQMEQSGYQPEGDRMNYPANAQVSENQVEQHKEVDARSYGPSTTGTSAAGIRNYSSQPTSQSVFFGH